MLNRLCRQQFHDAIDGWFPWQPEVDIGSLQKIKYQNKTLESIHVYLAYSYYYIYTTEWFCHITLT